MQGQPGALAGSVAQLAGLSVASTFSDATVFLTGALHVELHQQGAKGSDKVVKDPA